MKKSHIFCLVIPALIIFITACEKDKKNAPDPKPATTNPAQIEFLSAKITDKNNNSYFESFPSNLTITKTGGTYFDFLSYNASNNPSAALELSFTYTTGIFTLTKNGPYSAKYFSQSNFPFTVLNGTINITSFDTIGANQDIIKHLKATFSFNTDTVNNQYYKITEGIINYHK